MATVTKPIALDESINTTEQTPRNIADVLAEELARIAGNILPPNASQIAYDNTASGLTATNVQDAIDEVISSQADVIADTMADLTENKTATVTDGVADFETIDGSLVKSLIVEIEPSGAGFTQADVTVVGKNKIPMTLANIMSINPEGTWVGNVYTRNNVIFTVNTDSDGNVTGIDVTTGSNTATGTVLFVLCGNTEFNGDYALNGCPANGSTNTYSLRLYIGGSYGNYQDIGSGVNLSLTGSSNRFAIRIGSGASISSHIVFRPMLRKASETDSTFEPYKGKTYTTAFGQSITAGGTLDFLTGELTTGGSTLSLTPQTVKALVRENHISASTGDVLECKFSMMINGDDLEMLLS